MNKYLLFTIMFSLFSCQVFSQNIGISTTSPTQLLDVNGWVKLADENASVPPNTHTAGSLRYNTAAARLQFNYNSTSGGWSSFAFKTESTPAGIIGVWSGSIASIPSGWGLCDGGGGRPDLRYLFVYGANVTGDVGTTGGNNTTTLTSANLPSHTHTGTTTAGNPNLTFTGSGATVTFPTATFAGTAATVSPTASFTGTLAAFTPAATFAGTAATISIPNTFAGTAATITPTSAVFAGTAATIDPTPLTFTGTGGGTITYSTGWTGTLKNFAPTGTFAGTANSLSHTHAGTTMNGLPGADGNNCWANGGSASGNKLVSGGNSSYTATSASASSGTPAGSIANPTVSYAPAGTVSAGAVSYTPAGTVSLSASYTPAGTIPSPVSASYTPAGTVAAGDVTGFVPAGTVSITSTGTFTPQGTISTPSAINYTPAGTIAVGSSSVTPAGSVSGSSHTHTFTSATEGSGNSFDIRPAYYQLAYIIKL